jgi:hypothetical protein
MMLKSGRTEDAKLRRNVGIASVVLTYVTWIAMISILLIIAIPQIIQSVTDFANLLIVKIPEYTDLISKGGALRNGRV